MIEGVRTAILRPHADERGHLMELLRSDDDHFQAFAQAYVTLNYPGVIRAWHWHEHQWDYWAVVKGMVKAVCFDRRQDSATYREVDEFYLGDNSRLLLMIPPGVAHGYKTIGTDSSLLINFPTNLYDPAEPDELRIPYDDPSVPYDWEIQYR
jgi:dTDP-4-dehydrorhamnose 3,5-epimerase